MLLTALRLIALRKETLKRDIYFCFQPGEEGCGGASKLLEKYGGLPNGVAMCFAMHVGNHKLKGAFMIPEKEATANSSLVRI
jgi:metal-dependent amidase/aminoacylase/carboxypeptidase family protein